MINASLPPTTGLTPPPPTPGAEQPTAFYTKNGDQPINVSSVPVKTAKPKIKLVAGALLMMLLIAGSAVGLYLMNQKQDPRQQASEGTQVIPGEAASSNVCPLPRDVTWTGPGYSSGQCTHDGIMFTWKDVYSGNQSETGWEIFRSDPNDPTKNLDLDGNPTLLPVSRLPKNDTDSLSFLLKPTAFSQTTFYRIRIRPYYVFADGTRCHQEAQIGHQCSTTGAGFCPNPPVLTNRTAAWNQANTQANITWTLQSGTVSEFEIWNIGNGNLDPQNPKAYYLQKLKTLPADARNFVTTNIASLPTRRFLIKAISQKDDQNKPVCSDEWALCLPPSITSRTVKSSGANTFQFTWQPVQAPLEEYEIWLISQGDLDPNNPSAYYLARLADGISPSVSSYNLTIPPQYQNRPSYRFLIRASNLGVDGTPSCYGEWALAPGVTSTDPTPTPVSSNNRCTMTFTITAPTATPTSVPGATATPIPSIGCNQTCVTNADCSNPNHICFTDGSGVNRCRLETNPENASCQAAVTQVTGQPTQAPVVLPEQLPVSGPENWTTWLKAGLAILGMGAALLLML